MPKKPSISRSSEACRRHIARGRRRAYGLRLYVTDMTPLCALAFENLMRLCEKHLSGRYTLEVIDLLKQPERARADQITAVPTLVRCGPLPMRRVIGDLSDVRRVLTGLDLRPALG